MLAAIATTLAALIAAAVVLVGARLVWAPRSAVGFGIPNTRPDDPAMRSWLAIMGVRDIGTGLMLGVLLIGATTHLLGWVMLAAALIPAGDAAVVARSKGPRAVIHGVHLGTAATMVIIAALLVLA
ncbi:DUF4267 domain-containing protein [Streptomyces sp. NPDC097595]|uniref:DUF4267 domain-containing protein n=1 Tax=Streptomyces sp. NPDC097595 TaxID=3366090 RepID=UPI00381CFD45